MGIDIGQGQPPFPPQHQSRAQLLFQIRQLAAEGGLGDVQNIRRSEGIHGSEMGKPEYNLY